MSPSEGLTQVTLPRVPLVRCERAQNKDVRSSCLLLVRIRIESRILKVNSGQLSNGTGGPAWRQTRYRRLGVNQVEKTDVKGERTSQAADKIMA